MIKLTLHAKNQIESRGFNLDQIERKVKQVDRFINQYASESEVRVIISVSRDKIILTDGSNGSVVVACIDPRRRTVKTVMLQRKDQVKRFCKQVVYLRP